MFNHFNQNIFCCFDQLSINNYDNSIHKNFISWSSVMEKWKKSKFCFYKCERMTFKHENISR